VIGQERKGNFKTRGGKEPEAERKAPKTELQSLVMSEMNEAETQGGFRQRGGYRGGRGGGRYEDDFGRRDRYEESRGGGRLDEDRHGKNGMSRRSKGRGTTALTCT